MSEAEKQIREAMTRAAALAAGFTIDDGQRPVAYKGPRFNPDRYFPVPTEREEELFTALSTIHSWLVCAAITPVEDMAQSFGEMEQIAAAALAQAKDAEARG